LDEIEFIFDLERYEENPLWTDNGVFKINDLKNCFEVRIDHVCADFFMRRPFFRVKEKIRQENVEILKKILFHAHAIGAKDIEIPLLDHSSVNNAEEMDLLCRSICECLPVAQYLGLSISLETDLPPRRFRQLLQRFPKHLIGAVYDSGNSSGLGYDPFQEVTVLNKFIKNIHIKDRVLDGDTVPLGTGSADFGQLFRGLQKIGYQGGFTLQAARGEEGKESKNIQEQLVFLKRLISGYLT
ncbi:MAG: xylose isomerase-like TIM barrel, partial [Parcubacteria group bacterium Gr01-1014_44]